MSTTALLLLALVVSDPLPQVPPGPSTAEMGQGWAAQFETVSPRPDARVPWLKSATAVRLFLHGLPEQREPARARLVEAAAMILARHGRSFEQPSWDQWFRAQDWYQPRRDYSAALISEGEREALDRLVQAWHRLDPGGPTKR